MARKAKLTWLTTHECWSKFYQGTRYYLSPRGTKKSDKASYQAALDKFAQIKAQAVLHAEPLADLPESPSLRAVRRIMRDKAATTATSVKLQPSTIEGSGSIATAFATDYAPADKLPHVTPRVSEIRSLKKLGEVYLDERRGESERGEKSIATYREHRDKLDDFFGFAKAHQCGTIRSVTHDVLKSYRCEQLLQATSNGSNGNRISPITAKKRLTVTRRFFEWLAEEQAIDAVPSIIGRRWASVELPEPQPKHFTKAEINRLWRYAPDIPFCDSPNRLRLCIAIGLNCGFNPIDIATLTHEMIKGDILFRKRNKTGTVQTAKLWPVTRQLLKAEQAKRDSSDTGGLMLLGPNGRPLVHDGIKDLSTSRTDTIGRSFTRLKHLVETNGDGKGFKVFRKTGAQIMLDKLRTDDHVIDQYLGHGKKFVTRSYVARANFSELYAATDKLRDYLDLTI